MAIPGELSVAVYDSHPVLGEQYEFAFYMQPPYTPEAVSAKRDAMAKKWIEVHSKHRRTLRSKILTLGPFTFTDDERRTYDDHHLDDDEYVLRAWFKHDRPRILRASAVDQWMEARKKFGYEVNTPVSAHNGPQYSGNQLQLENDWADK